MSGTLVNLWGEKILVPSATEVDEAAVASTKRLR
jgi:hypothetical protein